MNNFISENYPGLITNADLKLYLQAGMINKDFYDSLIGNDNQQTNNE